MLLKSVRGRVVSRILLRRPFGLGISAGVALLLAGCGINALRTEYAANVGTQGAAVALASEKFMERVGVARRQATIEMVVADPACGRSPAIVRAAVHLNQVSPGWLCVSRSETPGPADRPFTLTRITQDIEPTLVVAGALSAYAEALSDIVDSKPSDPLKPLLDSLATARSAQGLILSISGGQTGPVPAADDPRLAAITEFVGFLNELSHEAGQVKELRKVIAEHPGGAAPVIKALRDHLATWENSRKGDEAIRVVIYGALLRRAVDASPPVSPDARRKALEAFYQMQDTADATAALHPALVKALEDLEAADSDLRRVLVEQPNLTSKERDKVAEINRQRAIRALDGLAAIITSFRGG